MDFGEDWLKGKILVLMNDLIKRYSLPFECVEQEPKIKIPGGRERRPDLVIWYRKPSKVVCVLELKVPQVDINDMKLVWDTVLKAVSIGAPLFALWNLNLLILWKTFELERGSYRLTTLSMVNVKHVADIQKANVSRKLEQAILKFLNELANHYLKVLEPIVKLKLLREHADRISLIIREGEIWVKREGKETVITTPLSWINIRL